MTGSPRSCCFCMFQDWTCSPWAKSSSRCFVLLWWSFSCIS